MYCLSCGASLPDGALFCLKCGKVTTRGMGQSIESEDASTVAAAYYPSDPYSSQPSSGPYGTPPPEGGTLNAYAPPSPYTPLAPPPPPSPRRPQRRRTSSGFVKGLISGILIVLLSAGIGTFLFLRQGAQSPSASSTVKSTTTSQTTRPTAAPTATPAPSVLYQADWSTGLDGWTGSSDWKAQNGMLISDGTNLPSGAAGPTIVAPYQVAPSGNFAIELKVQFAQSDPGSDPLLFHGSTTANGWQGYKLTACGGCGDIRLTSDDFNDVLGRTPFVRGTDWHIYRVEVRGPAMTVIVDGKTLFTATDSRFLSGGQVGIKSSTQLTVSYFKITSL